MNTVHEITLLNTLASLFWLVVAFGATAAVFSKRIRDTTMERLGLGGVAIGAFAAAWRSFRGAFVSDGGLLLSGFLALYVVAVVAKHMRPEHPTIPKDKSGRMPLEPSE